MALGTGPLEMASGGYLGGFLFDLSGSDQPAWILRRVAGIVTAFVALDLALAIRDSGARLTRSCRLQRAHEPHLRPFKAISMRSAGRCGRSW